MPAPTIEKPVDPRVSPVSTDGMTGETGPFTSSPAGSFIATSISADQLPEVPGYELVKVLGQGGMGIVYLAHQAGLKRPVALKMILARGQTSPSALARFKGEAEAVAKLQHPNIVQVFETGQAQGYPFIALEYVPGGSLAERLRDNLLPPRDAAELVATLAIAVQHAHDQGVIHRDLKPANVLLHRGDEPVRPSWNSSDQIVVRKLVPKISDFGLARQLDEDSERTHEGAVLGTPSYMAPEQALGQSQTAGPAADVYALGAILYACLTGRPPFKAATVHETLEQVRTAESVPPSRLQSSVPRDLETICLKCLEKDPRRRYASAKHLADDLARFLADEPIRARPVGSSERLLKWSRRHPGVALLSGVLAGSLLVGLATVTILWRSAVASQRDAKRNEEKATESAIEADAQTKIANGNFRRARANLYSAKMNLAETSWRDFHSVPTRDILRDWITESGSTDDIRGFEWFYLWRQCHSAQTLQGHTDGVHRVAFSPDGTMVASGSRDFTIRLWDRATGRELRTLRGHQQENGVVGSVTDLAFSPTGDKLASAGHEGTVRIWDPYTGELLFTYRGHKKYVRSIAFGPDNRVASVAEEKIIRIWDATTGKEHLTIPSSGPIAMSLDGKKLAGIGLDKAIHIWDATSGAELQSMPIGNFSTNSLTFGFGHVLGWSGWDFRETRGEIRVWSDGNAEPVRTFRELTRFPEELAFSPDGQRIAVASSRRNQPEGEVIVWNLKSGQEEIALRGHARGIDTVAYSADGKHLATGSGDHTVRIWSAVDRQEARTFTVPGILGFYGVSFAPDGRLAAGHISQIVRVWNPRTGDQVHAFPGPVSDKKGRLVATFAPDGNSLVLAGHSGTIKIIDLPQGTERFTMPVHRRSIQNLAFHPDGRRLVTQSGSFPDRGEIMMVDLQTRQTIGKPRMLREHVGCIAVSPDGRFLAWGTGDLQGGDVIVSDFESGNTVLTLKGHTAFVTGIAFDPHKRWIATSSYDNTVRLWDANDGSVRFVLPGHSAKVNAVAFSPDGRRVVSCSDDKTIKLWDPEIGQQTFTLRGHTYGVEDVAFSPDGGLIASAGRDGTVRVWDGTPMSVERE